MCDVRVVTQSLLGRDSFICVCVSLSCTSIHMWLACYDSVTCGIQLIYMSHLCHDPVTSGTWLIHMCVSLSPVHLHICDLRVMTQSLQGRDSFMCVCLLPAHLHVCNICVMTQSLLRRDSFICVCVSLICTSTHMWHVSMTQSLLGRDLFMCVGLLPAQFHVCNICVYIVTSGTWLIHVCVSLSCTFTHVACMSWLTYIWDVTQSCVYFSSLNIFTCVELCVITLSLVGCDSFICVRLSVCVSL